MLWMMAYLCGHNSSIIGPWCMESNLYSLQNLPLVPSFDCLFPARFNMNIRRFNRYWNGLSLHDELQYIITWPLYVLTWTWRMLSLSANIRTQVIWTHWCVKAWYILRSHLLSCYICSWQGIQFHLGRGFDNWCANSIWNRSKLYQIKSIYWSFAPLFYTLANLDYSNFKATLIGLVIDNCYPCITQSYLIHISNRMTQKKHVCNKPLRKAMFVKLSYMTIK